MQSRRPIRIDLNNLFQPAIEGGIQDFSECETLFEGIHSGILALKKTGQLPFSQIPEDTVLLNQVLDVVKTLQGVENVVVLGIGGSALGTSSIYQALKGSLAPLSAKKEKRPRLFVMDHIEPKSISETFDLIQKDRNLFIVISKSGNTSETLAQYLFVKKRFPRLKKDQVYFITDQQKGFLRDYATQNHVPTLTIPSGVGGRFSVFTPVGLFPLALCGVNVTELLAGAAFAELQCSQAVLAQNPAALLATSFYLWIQQKGVTQVAMMPYSDRMRFFSDWFAQLWSESLGKKKQGGAQDEFVGTTALKAVGVTDQHSQLQLYLEGPRDKLICLIEIEDFGVDGLLSDEKFGDERIDFLSAKTLQELMRAELVATEETLRENNRPNAMIKLAMINEYQLGQLYQVFMNVIPYMGALMGINAFDQPAVERIKQFTFGLMGRKGFEEFEIKMKDQKKKALIF